METSRIGTSRLSSKPGSHDPERSGKPHESGGRRLVRTSHRVNRLARRSGHPQPQDMGLDRRPYPAGIREDPPGSEHSARLPRIERKSNESNYYIMATKIGEWVEIQPFDLEALKQKSRQVRELCTFIEESLQPETRSPNLSRPQTGSKLQPVLCFDSSTGAVEHQDPSSSRHSNLHGSPGFFFTSPRRSRKIRDSLAPLQAFLVETSIENTGAQDGREYIRRAACATSRRCLTPGRPPGCPTGNCSSGSPAVATRRPRRRSRSWSCATGRWSCASAATSCMIRTTSEDAFQATFLVLVRR